MDKIITIGREFGSGGREIGQKLAEIFDIPFYDKELLTVASKESGIREELFYQNDEVEQGSIIYSLLMGTYSLGDGGRVYPELPMNYKIFLAQFDAIKGIAENGPCVIVGRCADYVLAGRKNLMSIFISADMEARVQRVKQRHPEISEKKPEDYIKKIDKKRSGYYYYFTDRKWGAAANYDFCIKSSRFGADKTAELIASLVRASG